MNDLPERITRRLLTSRSGCWEWQGARDRLGYGYVRYEGKVWRMHRLMWVAAGRVLPAGTRGPGQVDIDHICRNPSCCNPDHLEAVPHRENMIRSTALITACPQGHPYDEANTRNGADGGRDCRTCDRDRKRRKRGSRLPS